MSAACAQAERGEVAPRSEEPEYNQAMVAVLRVLGLAGASNEERRSLAGRRSLLAPCVRGRET